MKSKREGQAQLASKELKYSLGSECGLMQGSGLTQRQQCTHQKPVIESYCDAEEKRKTTS
jgi:hypothetical protein